MTLIVFDVFRWQSVTAVFRRSRLSHGSSSELVMSTMKSHVFLTANTASGFHGFRLGCLTLDSTGSWQMTVTLALTLTLTTASLLLPRRAGQLVPKPSSASIRKREWSMRWVNLKKKLSMTCRWEIICWILFLMFVIFHFFCAALTHLEAQYAV